ncbi:unnamed protein product [Urochloa decumbens]|uniref:F-box domain-containing protein n=1 Tax=Urochloa decumbens TaxID=240449 RepID=A0ABC9G8Y1_9POAL
MNKTKVALMSPSQQDGLDDGRDMLSELPDHLLLCVLERLRGDVRALARTCVLSRRWRALPLLLSALEISVQSFVPAGRRRTLQLLRQATGSFTGALRFFLATTPTAGGDQRRAIRSLRLKLRWMAASCPVTFGPGSAPSLEDMRLNNRAATWQPRFSLSELLENAHGLQSLRLSFGNDKVWVQPESPKVLGPAFTKLHMLRLLNVFPEGDLSWTMFLLQAAPLLGFVHIEVCTLIVCGSPT